MHLDKDIAVLNKSAFCRLEHLCGQRLIVRITIAMLEPEIARVIGIHRGHEIIGDIDKAVVWQRGIITAFPNRRKDRLVDRNRRDPAFIMLFAVAIASKRQHRGVIGRRLAVLHPARYKNAIFQPFDIQGHILGSGTREGRHMHPRNM